MACLRPVHLQRFHPYGAICVTYVALAVIEYLITNGTERAVDDIVNNSSQIAMFLNVRKKAEAALAILDDREKLQEVREMAAATRDNTSEAPGSKKGENEDEDIDFNPRGSSTSATARSNHLDLFGPSLIHLVGSTACLHPASVATPNVRTAAVSEVDLFAAATFQSANVPLEAATLSNTQDSIDLFAGRLSSADSFTSETELSVQEFSVHDAMSKSSQGKSPTAQHSSSNVTELPQDSSGGLKSSDHGSLE
uniref:Uncharacterized protein n=1 Tax=Leersia perrieri TaxID=77586 RepID=A0A0D9WN45_9ORYZ